MKVFTIAYDAAQGRMDDEELQAFQSSREVLELREHFFMHEGRPMWAVMLSYRDLTEPPPWDRERARQEERRQTMEDLVPLNAGINDVRSAARRWKI